MRKTTAFLSLFCLGLASLTACQQEPKTDPALTAAITALSNKEAAPAQAVDTSALEAKVDALSSGLTTLSGDLSGLKKSFNEDLSARLSNLKIQMSELEALSKQIKNSTESGGDSAELDALEKKLNSVDSNVSEIKAGIQALDFDNFIEIANKAADAQGQIITAREELRKTKDALKAMTEERDSKVSEIADLNDTIQGMKSGDVSKHPTVKTLRSDLDAAVKKNKALQEDYDQMKALADNQAEEIRKLRAGGATVSEGNGEKNTPKMANSFTYKITTAFFSAETKEYTVLANLVSGEAPAKGSEVLIVDIDSNIVCSMRVDEVYPANVDKGLLAQIGGQTIKASPRNAPLKGYRVIPSRTASASGK